MNPKKISNLLLTHPFTIKPFRLGNLILAVFRVTHCTITFKHVLRVFLSRSNIQVLRIDTFPIITSMQD